MAELDLLVIAYIIVAASATMFLVPFVLAPRGWASRVDNPKSKASRVLDKKLREVEDRLNKSITLGLDHQVQRVEQAVVNIEVAIKNLKIPEMPKEIQIDPAAFGPMIDERLEHFAKTKWGQRLNAAFVEDNGGAVENVAEAIALAQKDPGNAERLAMFIKATEQAEALGLIKPNAAKKAIEQARQLWRTGQDLLPLAQRFGISVEGGGGGSRGSSVAKPL